MEINQMMNSWSIDPAFWEEGYSLDPATNPTITRRRDDPVRPFISSQDAWDNYSDDVVYEVDKACREWLEIMCGNADWKSNWRNRRYDYSRLWWSIFGTSSKEDKLSRSNQTKIARIFAYYCSTVKKGYINASWSMSKKPGRMYLISPKRLKEPPYSLRLRVEWLTSRGIDLTFKNMKVPRDIEAGQSRYAKTQRAIDRRSEIARKAYQEKWGDYQRAYQKEYRQKRRRESEERSDS